ncbi:MAG: pyrimidine 5'-nucleotidase [Stappiaceae bacterium]
MDLSRFAGITEWIFDLDNTLYPAHTDLFSQINEKIRLYVSDLVGVSEDDAHVLQKGYYEKYGTTLRGLMIEHDIEPDGFLEFVHDIDHSVIPPDPTLKNAIRKLPGRRFIMTNGTRKHAENVANILGITDHFEDIFGIIEADLVPKPHRETYDLFLSKNGIDPSKSGMFEDLSRNLEVPHHMGMATTLIIPQGTREVFREDWELEGRDEAHVDFLADDLGAFLTKIVSKNGFN